MTRTLFSSTGREGGIKKMCESFSSTNISQILGIVAQVLVELNDSHTFFIPPSRPVDVDYGWKMQMIGNTCFITEVDEGSDAGAQGLKPGDEIVSLDGFRPTRENI